MQHPANQRHYTTEQARQLLAFAHVNDVLRLVQSGKLFARERRGARSKKGGHRWIIPASAITEYVESMGTNRDAAVVPTQAAVAAPGAEVRPSTRGTKRPAVQFV